MNKAWGGAFMLATTLALSGCGYAKKAPQDLPPAPEETGSTADADRAAAYRAAQEAAMAQRAASEQQSARAEAMRAYEEAKAAVAQAKKQVEAARKGHINVPGASAGSTGPSHLADSAAGVASDPGGTTKIACPQLGGLATPEECAIIPACSQRCRAASPPSTRRAGWTWAAIIR